MANRYWVGGSANWDATAGSKWSLTSGGAGGQAVPTAADDVFLDAASGAVTVTIATATATCKTLTCTGFIGTFAGSTRIDISGSAVLGSGMTFSHSGVFSFLATGSITTNGINITSATFLLEMSGTLTLQDNLITTGTIGLNGGTLATNDKNITCNDIILTDNICGITAGSSTITLTGTGTVYEVLGATSTFTAGTSTIIVSDTSSSGKSFVGGGRIYNNVSTSGGAGGFTIAGNNTFNTLTIVAPSSIYFDGGSTQTCTSFVVSGAGDATVSSGSIFYGGIGASLSQASGTVTIVQYRIENITVSGGATFNTTDAFDEGGNVGWHFRGTQGGVDAYTKLLIHGNGSDGSTNTKDMASASSPKTVTVNGNSQVDTAQKKFGTGSVIFDGIGDSLSIADSADWDFGTGDFTVDFWVRIASYAAPNSGPMLISRIQDPAGTEDFSIDCSATDMTVKFGGAQVLAHSSGPSVGAWTHIAISRTGTNLFLFVDGVIVDSDTNSTDITYSTPFFIGSSYNGNQALNGHMDEIRISKGIGRWTSNFTPPTAEYDEILILADSIKSINALPVASIKSISGLHISSVKSRTGLD